MKSQANTPLPVANEELVTVELRLPTASFGVLGSAMATQHTKSNSNQTVTFTWRGNSEQCTFVVECLAGAAAGAHSCSARMYCGARATELAFWLSVGSRARGGSQAPAALVRAEGESALARVVGGPGDDDDESDDDVELGSDLTVLKPVRDTHSYVCNNCKELMLFGVLQEHRMFDASELEITSKVLGSGNFGETRLAHIRGSSEKVVVKRLHAKGSQKQVS